MDGSDAESQIEAPRGTYPARVDDKGRLKLPVVFQDYLRAMGGRIFVTTLDGVTVRVYPISVWKENEKLLEQAHEQAEVANHVLFLANDMGADAEIDSQGRLLLHTELRRALQLENEAVRLVAIKGRVDVMSETVYAERRQQAQENLAEKVQLLERRGLK